jgi:two-component system, LytTR family, response regulator
MLRALIVDDEPPARKRLRAMLQPEAGIEIVGEAEDGTSTIEAIERLKPDLVFLDVQMPGMDGFEILATLDPHTCPAIVFVTAHDQFALRAFDAHAVDYLLKPFDRARLQQALTRVQRMAGGDSLRAQMAALIAGTVRLRPPRRWMVRDAGRIYFVGLEEIEWIGSAGHYAELHTASGTHLIREGMARLEARLDAERFVRVHRGAIVNVDRIGEMHPVSHGELDLVLKSGARLRVSRTYAAALQSRLAR